MAGENSPAKTETVPAPQAATFAELKAAFPKAGSDWLCEQLGKQVTMAQASAAYTASLEASAEKLKAENDQLKAEISRLKALLEQQQREDIEAAEDLAAKAHKRHR